jgi:rare lipoprotein A
MRLPVLMASLLILWSCASRVIVPRGSTVVYAEKGLASWYGPDFHGRRTSSGERYNMYGRSAAHRTLPLGSIARVTHLESGRQVVVRINDRGPFVEPRIIDLSYGAARDLGMVKEGVAMVRIEVFGTAGGNPFDTPSSWYVQAGSFADRRNAERLKARLGTGFGAVAIEKGGNNRKTYFRVRVGPFEAEQAAAEAAAGLRRSGYDALVVSAN